MIQSIHSTLKQPILSIVFGAMFLIFLSGSIKAQDIQFGLGASLGMAPSLSLNEKNSSASFYSVYADLILKKKFIGRAQLSIFNSSSFTGDLEGEVESGLALNGSLGYNVIFSSVPKLELPLMGTLGYVSVKDDSYHWPGMQFGATFAPKYMLTEKIATNITFRYLIGTAFNNGRPVSQTDVSFGVMFNLF